MKANTYLKTPHKYVYRMGYEPMTDVTLETIKHYKNQEKRKSKFSQ